MKTMTFLTIPILFLFGCAVNTTEHFQQAQREDTIDEYKYFLAKYPNSPEAPLARKRIEELEFEQIQKSNSINSYTKYITKNPQGNFVQEACSKANTIHLNKMESKDTLGINEEYDRFLMLFFSAEYLNKNTKELEELINRNYKFINDTVCKFNKVKLTIEQKYSDDNGNELDVSVPIEDISEKILNYAEIQIVDNDVQKYDFAISIRLVGKPLVAYYGQSSKRYSGAIISGNISYEKAGLVLFSSDFTDQETPPFSVKENSFLAPSSAPFNLALYSPSFTKGLLKGIFLLKGITPILESCKDWDFAINGGAVDLLGELRDVRLIPVLIELLREESIGETSIEGIYNIEGESEGLIEYSLHRILLDVVYSHPPLPFVSRTGGYYISGQSKKAEWQQWWKRFLK